MLKPLTLDELPPRLRKKIVLETDEENACWLWTGTTKAAKVGRYRKFYPPPDYEGSRTAAGSFRNDREIPMVRSREFGYAIPAHRAIYAAAHQQPVKSLPVLKRCANDLCVNPHHCEPQEGRQPRYSCVDASKPRKARQRPNLGIVGASGAITPLPQAAPAPERMTAADVLQRLRDGEVDPYQAPETAAAEAGIRPEDLTPHLWSIYYEEAKD